MDCRPVRNDYMTGQGARCTYRDKEYNLDATTNWQKYLWLNLLTGGARPPAPSYRCTGSVMLKPLSLIDRRAGAMRSTTSRLARAVSRMCAATSGG